MYERKGADSELLVYLVQAVAVVGVERVQGTVG